LQRSSVRRAIRFALSAAAVQSVYALAMAIGLLVLDGPRQAVLAVAYALALVVHFSLNRQWVFNPRHPSDAGERTAYRLGLSGHGARYVVVAAVVYGLTALSLGVLPGVLGIAPFLVWAATCAVIGVANFFLLERLVFR
jgi:putative flippase GtrA